MTLRRRAALGRCFLRKDDSPFNPARASLPSQGKPKPAGEQMKNLLELKKINKTFGEVAAVHDVNLTIGDNEIVGLLGDNGAGKSTLVKMITGYYQPDPGGEIYWRDQKVE